MGNTLQLLRARAVRGENTLHWAALCASQSSVFTPNTWLKWDRKRHPGCSSTDFQGPVIKLRLSSAWESSPRKTEIIPSLGHPTEGKNEDDNREINSQIPCYRFRGQPSGPRGAFPSWELYHQTVPPTPHCGLSNCLPQWAGEDCTEVPAPDCTPGQPRHITHLGEWGRKNRVSGGKGV